MPVSLQEFVADLVPSNTVLILGAGASIPSGAPSVQSLISAIGREARIEDQNLLLSEVASLSEAKRNRHDLIRVVRNAFAGLRPRGSILNLPLYDWKSIYSTNYDNLVEQSYERAGRPIKTVSSTFDFTPHPEPGATNLFKIHGTIDKDVVDGHMSRLILTQGDYDLTEDYREALYDRLRADLAPGTQAIIVGQSLADDDLRQVVERAISIAKKAMQGGRIALLSYSRDENRAALYESRGIKVAFGGLDDFLAALAKKSPDYVTVRKDTGSPLDSFPQLRPVTFEVEDELAGSHSATAIFNGWPAGYADIQQGLTFEREVAQQLVQLLDEPGKGCAVLLGAGGVGKTTAARQAVLKLRALGRTCWEHKVDHPLSTALWLQVAKRIHATDRRGVLLIDEAHTHLYEINELLDRLVADSLQARLQLILVSSRSHWGPRVKTPHIYAFGEELPLSRLSPAEIDRLLTLVEVVPGLKSLVEAGFAGFSRFERKRRLFERCESDMFVPDQQ